MKPHTVYKITNLLTGKAYIGASQNPKHRLTAHQSQNPHFFEGNGYQWEVLAENLSDKEASVFECEMVIAHKTLEPDGFNKRDGGYEGYKHRIDTLKKMSANYNRERKPKPPITPEQLAKLQAGRIAYQANNPHPMLGKHQTDAAKRRIGDANKGNTNWVGRKHTEETRNKMSIAKKGKVGQGGGPMTQARKDAISKTKLGHERSHQAAIKGWETRRAKAAAKPITF